MPAIELFGVGQGFLSLRKSAISAKVGFFSGIIRETRPLGANEGRAKIPLNYYVDTRARKSVMQWPMKRLISGLPMLFFSAANLLAQSSPPDDSSTPEVSDKAAAGIAALFGGLFCAIWLVFLGIWLWIAIWVMKDAKRRQSPNATLVTVLAWIPATTMIGLIVHLVTRPKTIPGATNQ
jgi:hypothetical protein